MKQAVCRRYPKASKHEIEIAHPVPDLFPLLSILNAFIPFSHHEKEKPTSYPEVSIRVA